MTTDLNNPQLDTIMKGSIQLSVLGHPVWRCPNVLEVAPAWVGGDTGGAIAIVLNHAAVLDWQGAGSVSEHTLVCTQ